MSEYLGDALKKVIETMANQLMDEVLAMRPTLVGDIHRDYPEGTGYIVYEEVGGCPAIIDSTATVIDETVKALPEVASHE